MSGSGDLVRVATWNVRTGYGLDGWHSWPFRRGAAAEVLGSLGADVVGLQEVLGWQLRSLQRAVPDHAAVGDGRDGSGRGERCPLLVGPALEIVRHRTLWLSDRPAAPATRLPGASHPRVATVAELEVRASGRRFVAVCTHLDERLPANRAAGVDAILGWLDPALPTLVLGDLNAGLASAPLERLAAAGFEAQPGGGGTAHGFTGRADGPVIDHILARGTWSGGRAEVVRTRPGGRLASDHWPVRARLRLGVDPHEDRPVGRTITGCGSASSAPTA